MAMLGAAVTLPVEKAAEVVDFRARTCPAKIASVSEVSVTPQVSGEILEVCFANGQTVAKGDVLYRLDPVKYIAAEKNAEAKVAEAKARLEYAGMQAVRYGELVKTRAVPRDDYDRVCSQREVYTALLAAAEADLAAARDDVEHCTIAAPIAGRVGSTRLTEGNFVTRGGAELVKLDRKTKPGAGDWAAYEKKFPFEANELPSALRIAYHGYGHAGISHVAVEDREARLVPKRVLTTEGNVLDPECVLVDDWTAVWFGCPDYHPAFFDNALAEKRSILEVELAE